jgi:hypothetical protein
MPAKYFLKAYFQPDWVEVSKADWIKAERAAGFRPKLSSDDPRYMAVCATGGFGSSAGISGKVDDHDD